MSSVRTSMLKLFDATVGALACHMAGRLIYWAGREIHLEPIRAERIKRVLVVRPGGMGDMILLQPVLSALRKAFPNAELELVCERRNRDIASLAGHVDRILTYDTSPFSFLSRLIKQPYDIAIDTEQFHHFSACFGWLSGARVRIGFSINPVRNALYTHLVNYLCSGPEPDQFSALLAPLGILDVAPVNGHLARQVPESSSKSIRSVRANMQENRPLLVVHPGSSVSYKQWGESKLAELLTRMVRNHQCFVIFVGTHTETLLVHRLRSRAQLGPEDALSMMDHTHLAVTAATIRDSDVFVGADSGLAHLAAAVGTPTVVIFGPSDEYKWGARGDTHRAVTAQVPCRPCCMFGYHKPCHTIACLQQITVKSVETALVEALQMKSMRIDPITQEG